MRELHGISQVEIARRLGIRQANISELEQRSRVQLATVENLVAAFGRTVELRAEFPKASSPSISARGRNQPHRAPPSPRKNVKTLPTV